MENKSGTQALERALGLIEILSENPEGLRLVEITEKSGLHKSTAHRILGSLISLGYVKKNSGSDMKYYLSYKLFEIAGRMTDQQSILKEAKYKMTELRDFSGEAVHLVARDGTEIVYIDKEENFKNSYRLFSRIGMRREMYSTGAGKSILAALSDEEIKKIWQQTDIKKYTENTILDLDKLMEEIAIIRKKGYAVDNEENEIGVTCVAASIKDFSSHSEYALSVSAPTVRMSEEKIEGLAKKLLEIKKEILR